MDSQAPTEHLTPSALGTKEHWEDVYTTELVNHSANPDDEGTIWFSDSSAEERIISYFSDLAEDGTLNTERSCFLDLGTGNGHMLFALREEGWHGPMVGVDYSRRSVDLARKILASRREEDEAGCSNIRFEEWDIMHQPPGEWMEAYYDGFDCVLDKGTFDAISLSAEVDEEGNRINEAYRRQVEPLLRKGGLLLVTSCNWTEVELRKWIEGGDLVLFGTIKYPSYTFGGVKGQTISSVCFRREYKDP